MTDGEVFAFTTTLKRVAVVFGKRTDTLEFKELAGSYFRALRRCELADLERGADAWIEREQKFPRPAEWKAAIPLAELVLPYLTAAEAREYQRAATIGYQDEPCNCVACVEAGVEWKPIRYVPELENDGRDRRARDTLSGQVVTAGHWAHGHELARWYEARADFYNRCIELGLRGERVIQPKPKRRSFNERLQAIFPEKPIS